MKVFLIGYMASGKSTLGAELAEALQLPFVDLDAYIESSTGCSISDLINDRGELYFRKEEHRLLLEVLDNHKKGVFALGGGTPVFYDHMRLLNEQGETIFLDVPVGELAQRLEGDIQRPLIQDKGDVTEFIAKHMFERRPFYSQAKHRLKGPSISLEDVRAVLN